MLFLAALLIYPPSSAEIPPPPVHLSMCLFKKPPCHVAFLSLPARKHDVFRPHLQRAAAVPGTCYSPSSTPISHPLSHTLHMGHACQGRKCCRSKCTATHMQPTCKRTVQTPTHAKAYHICPFSSLQQRTVRQIQCHLSNRFLKL